MKNTYAIFAGIMLLATPALSQDQGSDADGQMVEVIKQQVVLDDPCKRGPLPRLRIINKANPVTVQFLQTRHPGMPHGTASEIARDLCADTSIYGDSAALTARLKELVASHGF